MEKREPYPLIEITAETPFERGVQYGQQAADRIAVCVEHYKESFGKQGFTWEQAQEYAMGYLPVVEAQMPEILEEARGLAAGCGRSLNEIMAINCRYEISKLSPPGKAPADRPLPGNAAGKAGGLLSGNAVHRAESRQEPDVSQEDCTTAAILPEASLGGKTYAVKNWDFFQKIMDHIVLLRIRTKEYAAIGWTEAGQMPREGFNSFGVAIVNNGMQSVHDHYGAGLPVTFLRRKVLACKSFEEAAGLVKNFRRCVSNNIMLVGARGQVLDFEVQPEKMDQVYSQGGILTHANHFVMDPEADAFPERPKVRDVRLRELLAKRQGEIDVPYIMECMRDHEYWPKAICSHPTFAGDRRTYIPAGITVASMIVDFADNTAYICSGPPCQGTYIPYRL